MNIEEFRRQNSEQIKSYPLALQALWYDYQDDWHQSHKLIDTQSDRDCAWVHAYLHRKEGDLWNARYWYRRIDILYDQARLWSQNLDNQLPDHPSTQTSEVAEGS